MRRSFLLAGFIVVAGIASYVYERAREEKPVGQASSAAVVPVLAARAEVKPVPILLRGLGTVTAYNAVGLKSRVEGAITLVNFKEGQAVKTGDLLIQLDPRPYQAMLDQAKSTLVKDQAAALQNAKSRSCPLRRSAEAQFRARAAGRDAADDGVAGRGRLRTSDKAADRGGAAQRRLCRPALADRRRHRHPAGRHRQSHPGQQSADPRHDHPDQADLCDLHVAGSA